MTCDIVSIPKSMSKITCADSAGRITLRDLKRCRMAHVFYNTFFNLEKYLDNEQRDPFAVQKVQSCWDQFK